MDKYSVKLKKPVKKIKKSVKTKKPIKMKTKKLVKVKDCLSDNLTKKDKKCRRKSDSKIFELPRRFSRERCLEGVKDIL